MKTSFTKLFTVLVAVSAAGAFSLTAQTTNLIFGSDFDSDGTGNSTGGFQYAYAGSSLGNANPGCIGGLSPGSGVAGSGAWGVYPDFTEVGSDPNYVSASESFTYSGVDVHLTFGGPMNPLTVTSNLDSYILSFDAEAVGLDGSVNNTTIFVNELDFQTNGVTAVQFTGGSFTIGGSGFAHISVPLSDLTIKSGSLSDLANTNELTQVDGFIADFQVNQELGTIGIDRRPVWGFDNDNQLLLDNVELNQTSATTPTPLQEKVIWSVDFVNNQPDSVAAPIFRDGPNSATVTTAVNPTAGVGGKPALQAVADLSSWAATPPTSYSGFGPAVIKAIPFTLTSSNKNSYRVYLTAEAQDFLPGVSSAAGNLSFEFLVPPGTLTPSNANPAVVLELAPVMTWSNKYVSYVFNGSSSPIGQYNGGSQALFDQYVSKVNELQVQTAINGSPDLGAQYFGYETNATLVVDSIKVVELVPATPPVCVVATNNHILVYWSDPPTGGTAKLQSANNVAGPYVDVAGAASGTASPYTVPAGYSHVFFRTVWVP